MRALVWRGLDAPRMEIAHVEAFELARGTQRFVAVPGLTGDISQQRYEPLGGGVVRYRSGGFQADVEFDAEGFVTLYSDFLERIG